jgi:signal transduction histidine kinase
VTLSGSQSSHPALDAEVQALIAAAPIAAGIWVWYRDPWRRFAKFLVAAGFLWSLTALAESSGEVAYSTGRVFGWIAEPSLIFLVLAFPSGRLTTPSARLLAGATVALVALLYLPTALLADSYPAPSAFSSCYANCPGNAFMLVGSEPGFVGGLIVPVREVATAILLTGVIALLAARIRWGTSLMRITLVPVLSVAIVHALALVVGLVARRVSPTAATTDVLLSVTALSYGGVALGFLAGLSAWRLFENRTLRRLAAGFAAHPPGLSLRETSELLSEAMDPSLKIFYRPRREPNGWLDTDDRRARLPESNGVRCVTEIAAERGPVVAVVHDAALNNTPTFLAVTRSSVLTALENERLGTELRHSLRALRESRARIMSSADRERQRIERNLHDGAQQSLVALRIRLELASQLLEDDPARAERLLNELATEVDGTIEEVRSLAHGVYPSLLADRGLGEALSAVAYRSPVPTTVNAEGIGRYRQEIEAAVYFCCLEAVQNAMKHATGVRTISVSLAEDADLTFEVIDDGAGFVQNGAAPGEGITGMSDRLAAVGGLLSIHTAPQAGARVCGTIPLSSRNGSRAQTNGRKTPVLL